MIGLPNDRTRIERGLRFFGIAGALLGIALIVLSIVALISGIFGGDTITRSDVFSVFFAGGIVAVSGLFIAALGQFLESFRLMAYNHHRKDGE